MREGKGKGAVLQRDELSDLLASVAAKDRRALASVYDKTSSKLYGVCVRITRDHSAAEDKSAASRQSVSSTLRIMPLSISTP